MTHMTIKKTMLESISRFKSSKGDLLRAQGMTMAVWAACLCPLLFLLNASLRPLALPMRQSTAEAMQLFLAGAPMATVAMLPLNGYWKKVVRSLRMTGLMLLWMLPFAVMLGLLLYALTGMDFLTALGYFGSVLVICDLYGTNIRKGIFLPLAVGGFLLASLLQFLPKHRVLFWCFWACLPCFPNRSCWAFMPFSMWSTRQLTIQISHIFRLPKGQTSLLRQR